MADAFPCEHRLWLSSHHADVAIAAGSAVICPTSSVVKNAWFSCPINPPTLILRPSMVTEASGRIARIIDSPVLWLTYSTVARFFPGESAAHQPIAQRDRFPRSILREFRHIPRRIDQPIPRRYLRAHPPSNAELENHTVRIMLSSYTASRGVLSEKFGVPQPFG